MSRRPEPRRGGAPAARHRAPAPTGQEEARRRWVPPTALAAVVVAAVAVLGGPARASAQPETPPAHHYRLEARLRPDHHTVDGRARIRWTNESAVAVSELYLHLYLNAFASDRTVFMKESHGELRGVPFTGNGHIDIDVLRLSSGEDLLPAAATDLVEGDATQMRVALPSPVGPGEVVELEAEFRSTLPPVFARAGYFEDFHVVAQWFPKVARLDPDGTWATFPYHGNGEFYADFGRYDLEVDTPKGWVVGATGELLDERAAGERVVRSFTADDVHDAAFVTAPWLLERASRHREVHVRTLYPPGYELAAARHEAVVLAALAHYDALYGAYPYPTLTVVVPPRGAEGAAGMEYPTLFLTAGPWLDLPFSPALLGDVTAHELAHQWFQGMLGSNEVAHPMLDEGLTTWATWDFLQETYGRAGSGVRLPGLRGDIFELARVVGLRAGDPAPGHAAHEFPSGGAYGRSVYVRTALTLETVARTWGRERLRRALGEYARRHRFGHPRPEDLFGALDEAYWPGFSRHVLRPALLEGVLADRSFQDGAPTRDAPLAFPTTVLVDGRRLDWPMGQTTFDLPPGAQRVILDPGRRNLLDPGSLDDATPTGDGWLAPILHLVSSFLSAVGP